jgi:hypothetical protein
MTTSLSPKGVVVGSRKQPQPDKSRKELNNNNGRKGVETGKQDSKKPLRPPSSPLVNLNRLVTDSEGGSTVSNNRDLLAMLTEKKHEQRIPSAIVTKQPKPQKVSECVVWCGVVWCLRFIYLFMIVCIALLTH